MSASSCGFDSHCWHQLFEITNGKRPRLSLSSSLFRFQPALRLAGLPRIRFHDLRHVHAMLLLRNGVDIGVVRDVLGHSSIQLTADTYAGIMPALKENAAARLEKLLQRPG